MAKAPKSGRPEFSRPIQSTARDREGVDRPSAPVRLNLSPAEPWPSKDTSSAGEDSASVSAELSPFVKGRGRSILVSR